jgi:hypothetical protein
MGFIDTLGKAVSQTADAVKKSVGKIQVSSKLSQDEKDIKRKYLSKLTHQELEQLYRQSFSYSMDAFSSGIANEKATSPKRMTTANLVEALVNMDSSKIQHFMVDVKKFDMASNFKYEVDKLNKRYESEFAKIENKPIPETNGPTVVEESYVTETAKVLEILLTEFLKRKEQYKEKEFHEQAIDFLKMAIHVLEARLKFNPDIQLRDEFRGSSQTNEAIDSMITINKVRIGIEMKKDVITTSTSQRLLGQIARYLRDYDGMIILIFNGDCDNITLTQIDDMSKNSGKLIKVVTTSGIR